MLMHAGCQLRWCSGPPGRARTRQRRLRSRFYFNEPRIDSCGWYWLDLWSDEHAADESQRRAPQDHCDGRRNSGTYFRFVEKERV